MLDASPVTTMLPVVNLERARRFYEGALGLVPGGSRPDGKFVYRLHGGGSLALFPRGAPTRADHTAVSFEVPDVARTVRELTARGVQFEDYDLPGLKTVDKVCVLGSERAAWFKDPEGNILCVHELVR
jgi:catechol 2,3-dioxygenase-like lactoylglutathione lyase family enzyme